MKKIVKQLVKTIIGMTVKPLLLLYGWNHGLYAEPYQKDLEQYKELIRSLFFQKIFRLNAHVPWPVHFTSRVGTPNNFHFDKHYVRCFQAPGCYWQGLSPIYFKGCFLVAQYVDFISNNHDIHSIGSHTLDVPPIIIGDNCLFSSGCVILPGVELGDNTIVAANAVVNKSFPEGNCVIGGVPAKILKKLDPDKIIRANYKDFWPY